MSKVCDAQPKSLTGTGKLSGSAFHGIRLRNITRIGQGRSMLSLVPKVHSTRPLFSSEFPIGLNRHRSGHESELWNRDVGGPVAYECRCIAVGVSTTSRRKHNETEKSRSALGADGN